MKWLERFDKEGVCDFELNQKYYFRFLLNKVMQLINIKNAPETINKNYLKANLLLDGDICITDFNDELYACIGALGGQPDEYYVPIVYTIANPILGSKMVYRRDFGDYKQNGVVIFNEDTDSLGYGCKGYSRGLYDMIYQTSVLLADNVVSINCAQINSRVQCFFTADGEGQAVAGEAILRKMYSGRPYQVIRSDIVDEFKINPMSTASTSTNISELVELNNYILANFYQGLGIKSNDIRKKERLITAEIEEQDNITQISLLEIIASWRKGFDEVNRLYGTEIEVELNPTLLNDIAKSFEVSTPDPVEETPAIVEEESQTEEETETEEVVEETVEDPVEEEAESPAEVIEEQEEVVDEVIDMIIDAERGEDDAEISEDDQSVERNSEFDESE